MMRHAMGIRCVFFPEETGHDLKFTEVNGGFPSHFPSRRISPWLCTSQLAQALCTKKCPLPSLIPMHPCAGMGLLSW